MSTPIGEILKPLMESARKAEVAALSGLRSILTYETGQWVAEGETRSYASIGLSLVELGAVGIARIFNKQDAVFNIFRETDASMMAKFAETYGRAKPYIYVLTVPELWELIARSRKRGTGLKEFLEGIERLGKTAVSNGARLHHSTYVELHHSTYVELHPSTYVEIRVSDYVEIQRPSTTDSLLKVQETVLGRNLCFRERGAALA